MLNNSIVYYKINISFDINKLFHEYLISKNEFISQNLLELLEKKPIILSMWNQNNEQITSKITTIDSLEQYYKEKTSGKFILVGEYYVNSEYILGSKLHFSNETTMNICKSVISNQKAINQDDLYSHLVDSVKTHKTLLYFKLKNGVRIGTFLTDYNDCQLLKKIQPTFEPEISNDFDSIISLKKILIKQSSINNFDNGQNQSLSNQTKFSNNPSEHDEEVKDDLSDDDIDQITDEELEEYKKELEDYKKLHPELTHEQAEEQFLDDDSFWEEAPEEKAPNDEQYLQPVSNKLTPNDNNQSITHNNFHKNQNSFKRNMVASLVLNILICLFMFSVYGMLIYLSAQNNKTRGWFLSSAYFYSTISIAGIVLVLFIAVLCTIKKTYFLKFSYSIVNCFAFFGSTATFISLYSNHMIVIVPILFVCFTTSFLFGILSILNTIKQTHPYGYFVSKWITCLVSLLMLIIFILVIIKGRGLF